MTTPASPTIEYPTTCSRSSWIQAANVARMIDAAGDGDDDRALGADVDRAVARSRRRPRRAPTIASDAGPRARRIGSPVSGHGVGQPGDDDVEGDDAEPDRHGEREREVGEPEDDRLRDEVLQVAPDPGRRGDRHRAGDHHGPQVPQADAGADPRAGRARS